MRACNSGGKALISATIDCIPNRKHSSASKHGCGLSNMATGLPSCNRSTSRTARRYHSCSTFGSALFAKSYLVFVDNNSVVLSHSLPTQEFSRSSSGGRPKKYASLSLSWPRTTLVNWRTLVPAGASWFLSIWAQSTRNIFLKSTPKFAADCRSCRKSPRLVRP
jgi:hypothetical protein